MGKLTDTIIKATKPPNTGRTALTDGSGLQLRITEKNHRSWSLQYTADGKKKKVTLGQYPEISLREARILAAACKAEINKGIDPNKKKEEEKLRRMQEQTFEQVYEIYRDQHLPSLRPRTRDEYIRSFTKDILPEIGSIWIKELKRRHVAVLGSSYSKTPVYANRVVSYVGSLMSWAHNAGIIDTNPLFGMRKPFREESRKTIIEIDKMQKIYEASKQVLEHPHQAAFHMLIFSCMRRSEVCKLTWSEIYEDRIRIPAERSKNKNEFDVPLTNQMKKILATQAKGLGPYVFSTTDGLKPIDLNSKMLRRIRDASGVFDWHIHDFRRAATTYMQDHGALQFVVNRVLSHLDSSTTGIYARSDFFVAKQNTLKFWEEALLGANQSGKVIPLAFARS